MKQVAYAGLKKALITVIPVFAAGFLVAGEAVYAQDRKAPQPSQIEAEALAAMQLPGIFKITPEAGLEITQKGLRPAPRTRTSQPLFAADAGKVTGVLRLPRAEKPAPAQALNPKRADAQTRVAKKDESPEANRTEAKKILIPAQLAARADRSSDQAFHATAYCLKGRTASGEMVRTGLIAADPKVLPLGTLVQIEAGKYSGVYKVADTGGAIKGNKIDIYVPSYREAKLFGRQKIKVTVLGKGKKSR